MEGVEKLRVGILPQSADGVAKQTPKFLNEKSSPPCELVEIPHIQSLDSLLRDGNLDLMAVSSKDWDTCHKQGLMVLEAFQGVSQHGFLSVRISLNICSKEQL